MTGTRVVQLRRAIARAAPLCTGVRRAVPAAIVRWAVRHAVPCAVLVLVSATGARIPVAAAAPIFTLADASTIIVYGTVEKVTPYKDGALRLFVVRPEKVLKGEAAADTPILLVQEILFETERPHFEVGARTLVFAVPLPNYSSYRAALPPAAYYRWTERKDTAAEIASLADPALLDPLARYLAVRDDAEATARFLGQAFGMSSPRVRAGAIAAIEDRRELVPLLDTASLATLPTYLRDDRVPLQERAAVLVRLARVGAAGVGPIAEEIAAGGGGLLPAAVDALVTLDRLPSEARLLTYSRSEDAALRLAAVRGLGRRPSAQAVDRLAEVLASDPEEPVRLAAIQALGRVPGPRAVNLLAAELNSGEKGRINAAADALATHGSAEAVTALADTLTRGSYDAQVAAAFALGRGRKPEGMRILREQVHSHPDPRVQKVIKIALGEAPEEHE